MPRARPYLCPALLLCLVLIVNRGIVACSCSLFANVHSTLDWFARFARSFFFLYARRARRPRGTPAVAKMNPE